MKTYLGKGGATGNTRVYLAVDCLEIEQEFPVEIVRHRIYLDDVLMLTHSRRFGWNFLVATGILSGICALAGIGFAFDQNIPAAIGFGVAAIAAVFPFVVRLINRVDVITIFGRRKRCEITYGRKKDQVQKHFDTLVTAIREKIAATNARIEREKPVVHPPEEVGPMPEAGALPDVGAPPDIQPEPVATLPSDAPAVSPYQEVIDAARPAEPEAPASE